ncbi:glycosyltransferase family 4 protein [Akkermansiaceae bacterium]|nr:glycosyltransferase family 4 protein [Akkermansiaceae bacterium]
MNKNTLHIVHTHPRNLGGVANHYRGLKDYWPIPITTSLIGSRFGISGVFFFCYDLISLITRSRTSNAVLLNPSMQKKAFWRDYLLLLTLIGLNKRVVVFFHGWDMDFARKVLKNRRVIKAFGRCKIITLASCFKQQLEEHGINKVYTATTKYDEKLLKYQKKQKRFDQFVILFTGRLVKSKGVQKILEAVAGSDHREEFKIIVAGDGAYKNELIRLTDVLRITDLVEFAGYVRDDELANLYRNSDLYVLATSHNEGMPTTILEALAFGLPIISTNVGGITDIISDGRNGFIVDKSVDCLELRRKIEFLYLNRPVSLKIRQANLELAEEFSASNVARKLVEIIFERDSKLGKEGECVPGN